MTKTEAVVTALVRRGEKRVVNRSVTKYDVWTRTYCAKRREDGSLVLAPPFDEATYWYIGKRGFTVRFGKTSTDSKQLRGELIKVLVGEGQIRTKGEADGNSDR